jgi:anhydro-N-acetylmuramic acid kinase
MGKIYSALGLMSGTSMDGVDASIIQSDGNTTYKVIFNKYFQYNKDIFRKLTNLRDKINSSRELNKMSAEIISLEKEITLFHAEISKKIILQSIIDIDFVGFHGQTIFHNIDEKMTKQIGDGNLLSQLIKKKVIYDFRQNDLKNGGEGAPLTPIFHKLLVEKLEEEKKIKTPVVILNIGGITNATFINTKYEITSLDVGPGNCLIDKWIRVNSEKNFDENGDVARSGKIDKFILEQSLDNYYNNIISEKKSLDISDFDISFARGLSLENGASTLTEFTAEILSKKISGNNIYVCGGGRKNQFLIDSIQKKIKKKIQRIDTVGINGDFIESQAFGYLAIRSYLGLPISFPKTTGCKEPSIGGVLANNY